MSAFASVDAAFALALASQAEPVGATRLDASASDLGTPKPDIAALLATVAPMRAAFASALQGIDIANAPQVAGPYVPGMASGPLTEDDIFDPSKLYSLPGQDLVVFEEASASDRATSVPSRLAEPAMRPAVDSSPASKPVVDFSAGPLEVRPSAVTLELAIASYMSLLRVGLAPTKSKMLRGLKSRNESFRDDRARWGADERDHDDRVKE